MGVTWKMHASYDPDHPSGPIFQNFGHPRYVEMYGREPVAVEVTEDPEGDYYGWIYADKPDDKWSPDFTGEPTMIQPHRSLFNMQFPYGPAAMEERGDGTIVRLSVAEA